MDKKKYNLLLADDDEDDCAFFKDALDELLVSVALVTVNDGVELMDFLSDDKIDALPDLLFLDLNMPRKSGLECFTEIKKMEKLKTLPVIIFSTSMNTEVVDMMYEKGAIHYIQKPCEYNKLKKVIETALTVATQNNFQQPRRESFILQP